MNRKWISLLTVVGLCLNLLCLPAGAASSDSGDVDLAVEVLSSLGIVSGYSDGSYHPEDGLTRAQFCKLAVLAEGHGDQVTGSAYRTLFSDVTATHWGLPYVNLAYEEGLVSGYGDGTFGPDDPVTVGQAVTVLLRLLGYTTEDVGPFWPEDYMSLGEKLGLLDGVSADPDHELNRGEAALMLYGLLSMSDRNGGDYIDNLCASKVSQAVLLDTDAQADDGATGMVKLCTSQGVTYYEPAQTISQALVGSRGTLLLDSTGSVVGFLPDDTAVRTISLAQVAANGVTDSAGSFYSISNSVSVLLDDVISTYSACWYDLDGRSGLTLYYNQQGVVDLVTATQATTYEGVMLSGYYEDVSPNTTAPDTITLLGIELPVAESGQSNLAQFSVGDRITVTLNGAGEVVSAVSYTEQQVNLYGVLGGGEVILSCGLTVKGTITNSGSAQVGTLVKVTSTAVGKLSVSPAENTAPAALDLTRGTLGSIPLADDVVVYERVKDSAVVEISLDDILVSTVAASSIDFYATNARGEVSVLLLDDVTGSAYTYGMVYSWMDTVGTGDDAYTIRMVTVTNSGGTSQNYTTILSVKSGVMGGIAVGSSGTVIRTAALTSASAARSDFDGEDAVTADGVRIPISDTVQVYNSDTGKWITLAQAKAYTDSFTVYYSGTLGVDAVVRVIVTQ